MTFEFEEDVGRCPTCGRFLRCSEGFMDVGPGGRRGSDENAFYCNEDCADNMVPRPRCEDHNRERCASCMVVS